MSAAAARGSIVGPLPEGQKQKSKAGLRVSHKSLQKKFTFTEMDYCDSENVMKHFQKTN